MRVLLIHGLGRSPLSVFGLSQFLQRSGYRTELFGYSSLLESYAQIIGRLQDRVVELSEDREYGIIAHSLGGLLVRSALAANHDLILPKPVILLGPPNQSPRIAQLAQRFSPFSPFAGDCFKNLADPTFYRQLPPLNVPHTIIAGTDGPRGPWSFFGEEINDGVLTLKEVQGADNDSLPATDVSGTASNGSRQIMLPINHIQMLNHPLVQQAILQILQDTNQQALPSIT